MDINLIVKEDKNKNKVDNMQGKTQEELQKLQKKYVKGCGKIYHEHGVYTAKGDALYDFQCNFSHLCQQCKPICYAISAERRRRNDQKIQQSNKNSTLSRRQVIRKKYFEGQPGCECTKENMCKQCFTKLQNAVTTCEKGCGATWEEEFGGMAAGPAWVTCADNYFLCSKCSEQLAFINSLNKQYPHIKLEHMPQIQKMFWSPRSYPYYQGYL